MEAHETPADMTCSTTISLRWFVLPTWILMAMVIAGVAHAEPERREPGSTQSYSMEAPTEPSALVPGAEQRAAQRDSLFAISPLGWLRDDIASGKRKLYDATGLRLAAIFTHVFQGVTDTIDGEDDTGTATTMDFAGIWELFDKGEPTQAQAVFHVQSRWDYSTTGPEDLGAVSIGSILGTADTFSEYSQTFVMRNFYWRQGDQKTGWVYRLGKITPDAMMSSSPHLDSQITFLPSGGTGPFAIALPDSGFGAAGGLYFGERWGLGALVSDANGDRTDRGDIGEGDLFSALELQVKIAPKTEKAPYSKVTVWHTDGTKDGSAVNAQAGPSGWGYFLMHQQELSADGRWIGILRYGKSFDDAAVYDELAAAHLLLYEPGFSTRLKNDVIGAAFNWARAPFDGTRSEYHFEIFYRFPIFPNVDTTLSYQAVSDPALDLGVDDASVFSLRFRAAF